MGTREVERLTDNRFLNICQIKDPEHHVKAFQYAERLGVDSVAFICVDRKSGQYLLNREYKPPVNEFVNGAFGGSMDKDVTPQEIVIDEANEEAGFIVGKKDVISVGKVLVSTQMNQWCHLFLVVVNKDDQGERHPENAIEAMATTEWADHTKIQTLDDWKPMAILIKALTVKAARHYTYLV